MFGTPLYVYDLDLLKRVYTELRQGLTPHVEIFYSVKANPALGICGVFHRLGTGAEIASLGELETVLKAGFSPDEIVYAGPGKTARELEAAVEAGILSINAESLDELEDMAEIGERLGKRAAVSVRVNPVANVSGSHQRMGGEASPFGIDEEKLPEALRLVASRESLELRGIHVYVGNQILDAPSALRNMENTLEIARRAAPFFPENRVPLVNLGGGWGVPYYKREPFLDAARLVDSLNWMIQGARKEPVFRGARFILKLGRFLTAPCGVFLARVLYTKESRGRRFAVVDGGMQFNAMATGNLGQKIRRRFLLCAADRMDEEGVEKWDVVGPLCTPMDHYGRDYEAPPLKGGDLVGVLLAGAYGLTASPVRFLSHPCCAEVAVSGGEARPIRRRETAKDVLDKQFLLEE